MTYKWVGWFDGAEDCEPPEPGKYWLEIQDESSNEFCVIILRTEEFDEKTPAVLLREERAQLIVEALNMWEDAL